MDLVTGWTGRAACALQAALRMSNEAFAEDLGIGVRTVAAWHQKPGLRPRPEMQQVLDAPLARAPGAVRERFAVLIGEPVGAVSARTDEDGAAADAEHRLIADQNISGALHRLDQLAAWEPGTARRKVAARLVSLDRRDLLDRASRRGRIGRGGVDMGDDPLESELGQVTAELATVRTEYASLGARIAGLQARHAALSRAVSGPGQQSRPSAGAASGYRTDAIVAVLDAADTEMSINDVVAALRQAGRGHETYDNVGVDLAYLAERGRITRVRRGIYAPASG